MNRIYIVTGANGHLGSAVVSQLSAMGKTCRALVLPNESTDKLNNCNCEIYRGDVLNPDSLKQLFTFDSDTQAVVIHCAGIVTVSSKSNPKVYDVNVNGTKNIADLCVKNKVYKMVHVSSVHAIPTLEKGKVITEVDHFDPEKVVGYYAKTKAIASQYILDRSKNDLNACIVHPSGILGPYDYGTGHLTHMVIDYTNHSLKACVHGGYDFVDVRDVASGIIVAVEKGGRGQCYILSNHYYEVSDILGMLSRITNQKRIKTILPMWFAKMTAPLAEMYYKIKKNPPLFTSYSLYTLTSNSLFSHEKASKELGYTTRPMLQTLADTVEWLSKNVLPKKLVKA